MSLKISRQNQALSNAHENHVLRELQTVYPPFNVKLQPGSGNQATAPNDILVKDKLYVECKATYNASISLKLNWLTRLKLLAVQGGLRVVLAIRFQGTAFRKDYYMIDEDYFMHLLECEEELLAQ